jgi:hypothetical protein
MRNKSTQRNKINKYTMWCTFFVVEFFCVKSSPAGGGEDLGAVLAGHLGVLHVHVDEVALQVMGLVIHVLLAHRALLAHTDILQHQVS